MQLELFSPSWRGNDPETSRQAAESISQAAMRESHLAILAVFKKHNALNDEELAALYSIQASEGSAPFLSPSGLRSRRSELHRAGYLKDSGTRTKTQSGRASIVWEITDEGKRK